MKIEEIAISRGYYVTEDGQLISPKGKLVGAVGRSGYVKTSIRVNGVVKIFKVHRLQAYQLFGVELFKEGIVTRHLNGIKTDNSAKNIAIGTHSDNMRDIPILDMLKRVTHASSFTKKHDHVSIRDHYKTYGSYKLTMQQFGLSSSGTLHFILNPPH